MIAAVVMRREPWLWALAFLLACAWVWREGARGHDLEQAVAVTPRELYGMLARSQVKLQVIDARPSLDEYEDMHVPGAIPMPGCALDAAPPAARPRILRTAPTIIVSDAGDPALFARCAAQFASARNTRGGMSAWDDENLPEDSGSYSPPKAGAGGGCL